MRQKFNSSDKTPSTAHHLRWNMMVAVSCYRCASQHQGKEDWSELREGWMWPNTERCLKKACSRVHATSDRGRRFTFQHDSHSIQPRQCCLYTVYFVQDKSLDKPEDGSSQMLPIWWDRARIYQEEWDNLSKSRCAKLVEIYPRRFEAVIAAKGPSTKYEIKGLNMRDFRFYWLVIHWQKIYQFTTK